MEPDWGTQSVFSSRPSHASSSRKTRKHHNVTSPATIVEVESRKQTDGESSSRSASPVIQMPPRNFYNYPDRYYEHRPSLFQVVKATGQRHFRCNTAEPTKVNTHTNLSFRIAQFHNHIQQTYMKVSIDLQMWLTGLIDGDGRLFMKLDLIDNKQITTINSCPVNIDSNIDPFNYTTIQ